MIALLTILLLTTVRASVVARSGVGVSWIDVCDYQDPTGHKCCEPAMEGHQYLVMPQDIDWTDHAVECG